MLEHLRTAGGHSPEELAKIAGISISAYFDLESREGELDYAVSVGSVARVAHALGIRPSVLYGGTSVGTVSVDTLASRVREELRRTGTSLSDFERDIGWAVGPALANSEDFRTFNADGLRAVCSAVHINWFDVLDAL